MPLTGPITQIRTPIKGKEDGTDWRCGACAHPIAVGLSRTELLPHVTARCPACGSLQQVPAKG